MARAAGPRATCAPAFPNVVCSPEDRRARALGVVRTEIEADDAAHVADTETAVNRAEAVGGVRSSLIQAGLGARRYDHDRARCAPRNLGGDAAEERRTRAVRPNDDHARVGVFGGGDETVGRVSDFDQALRARVDGRACAREALEALGGATEFLAR
jgi:hypothetical protein